MSQNWPKVKVDEVLTHYQSYVDSPEPRLYPKLSVRLYGKGVVIDAPAEGALLKMKRHQLAKTGQVILSEIWGKKGAIGFVPPEGEGSLCTSHFFLFDVHTDRLDPRWLQAIFDANYLQEQLDAEAKGTTGYAAVRPKILLACEVPLPPLEEQRRVVARIEELAAKVREARALSQQAVEEAEALVRSARNDTFAELQKNIRNAQLGDVCLKITDGPHVSPRYVEHGIPFISVRNISESGLDFSSAKYISEADHIEFSKKARVQRGDVLYTKGGTTGVARRVDSDRAFSIWVHVALLKLNGSEAVAGFVEHMLNSSFCKEQAEFFTRGSSNHDLGLSRMSKISFPLPPIPEQRKIIFYLDDLQKQTDALKALQTKTSKELDALMPSILDKAFRGEL